MSHLSLFVLLVTPFLAQDAPKADEIGAESLYRGELLAGIGVREGALIFFLNPMLGAGGAVVAVVARLWTTVVELLPALLLAGGYLKASKTNEDEGGVGG